MKKQYYVVNTVDHTKWLWSIAYKTLTEAKRQLLVDQKCAKENGWSQIDCWNCISIYITTRDDMQGWQKRGVPVGKWLQV